MDTLVFDNLVYSLESLINPVQPYPHPSELAYSMHVLALHLGVAYPRTTTGFLAVLAKPVASWWPTALELPRQFDHSASLLYDEDLSEEAREYYYELLERGGLNKNSSFAARKIAGDNLQLRELLEGLWQHYSTGDAAKRTLAQADYVTIRKFIINYPWAGVADFRRELLSLQYIKSAKVGELYEEAGVEEHWNCEECGPLFSKDGRLHGAKPSACNKHYPGAPNISLVHDYRNRRLKIGIHLRTHLPGIPELRLFKWLEKYKELYPAAFTAVELWPGIDRYDLRLEFRNEVWAVDVKDYKDPFQLGAKLGRIFGEGALAYQQSFYVIPDYRLKQRPDYVALVLENAPDLPAETRVISDAEFKELVLDKLSQLKKKGL